MKILFKFTSLATSALFVYLFVELFFFSDSFVMDLGLAPSITTLVLSRRTAMFMLGIAILMFLSRNLLISKLREIVCISTGITLLGLSIMGTYEFVNGNVNSSILVAIVIESILWVSYGVIIAWDRKAER